LFNHIIFGIFLFLVPDKVPLSSLLPRSCSSGRLTAVIFFKLELSPSHFW